MMLQPSFDAAGDGDRRYLGEGAKRELQLLGKQLRLQHAEAVFLPFRADVGKYLGDEVRGEWVSRRPAGPAVAELIGRMQVFRSIEGNGGHGVGSFRVRVA